MLVYQRVRVMKWNLVANQSIPTSHQPMSTGHSGILDGLELVDTWGWRLPKIQSVLALHIVGCSDSGGAEVKPNRIEPICFSLLCFLASAADNLLEQKASPAIDFAAWFCYVVLTMFFSFIAHVFVDTKPEFLSGVWIKSWGRLKWLRGQEWVWWHKSQPSDVGRSTSSTFAWGRTCRTLQPRFATHGVWKCRNSPPRNAQYMAIAMGKWC